ncbi:MAG: 2-amino-4-hydroxy-6-hydroxymethyldihydropteridine diphosphokinase [Planctomycetes bacterium]|nr:2-amino-4-hydroxy-6-hydroxymethyldihydropteridine diphosphokinase [Planctomycetota bacterium]
MLSSTHSKHISLPMVFLGLGSNLGNPAWHIKKALGTIDRNIANGELKYSSFFHSPPLEGSPPQDDFTNVVCSFATHLCPDDLLEECQKIENNHGRTREVHWGPRTLDIDILLYGNLVRKKPHLTLPHPHMHSREFVLVPLIEIAPRLICPVTNLPYAKHLKKLKNSSPSLQTV